MGEDEGDEGEDEDEEFITTVLDLVSEDFAKKHGCPPTMQDLSQIMESYNAPKDEKTRLEAEDINERARALCEARELGSEEEKEEVKGEDEKDEGKGEGEQEEREHGKRKSKEEP